MTCAGFRRRSQVNLSERKEEAEPPVVVTGATGLIGRALCAELALDGILFTVLSRDPDRARKLVPHARSYRLWQPIERGSPWASLVEKSRAIVHLAGPLTGHGHWNHARRQELYEGCVTGTRGIVSALAEARTRPEVLISASACSFYSRDPNGIVCQGEEGARGEDFLSLVTGEWESAALRAETFGVRVVLLRFGLVLAPDGALGRLRRAARVGLGGPVASGEQLQPWIHREDAVGLIRMALSNKEVSGPLNAVAPEAVTNRHFMTAVCSSVGKMSGLPQPKWWLRSRLGAGAVAVTDGRGAVPTRARELGYRFRRPTLEEALELPAARAGLAAPPAAG